MVQASTPVSAYEVIDSLSKQVDIILINENHNYVFHRVFINNLLDELSSNGYSLIGLEALSRDVNFSIETSPGFNLRDSLLNSRAYPLYAGHTGTYTKEPQMGNLVRRGRDLNFEFFGYEKLRGDRELNQAKNIAHFRRKFPDRKMLIVCGFMHLAEDSIPGINVKLMGHYLNEELDEEILTIEQTRLSFHPKGNSKLYDLVSPQQSIVLEMENGEYFNSLVEEEKTAYDLSVFHPRFALEYNRPKWLGEREGVKCVDIDQQISIKAPFVMCAHYVGESHSTPVDVVHIDSHKKMKPLYLLPGEYSIKCLNDFHEEQVLFVKVD